MITIKEEFYDHAKVKLAHRKGGAEALLLWHQMKAYCAKRGSGFVPSEALEDLPLPVRNLRRSLAALRDCGELRPDGKRSAGLLDEVAHGWELHDYGDHAQDEAELEDRRQVERDRKQLYRDRCRARVLLTESGVTRDESERRVRDMSRDEIRDLLRDMSRDTGRDMSQEERDMSQDKRRDTGRDMSHGVPPRADVRVPAPVRARRASAPDPNPTQPNPTQPNDVVATAAPRASNLQEALMVPIRDRCRRVLDSPFEAQWLEPHLWPEFVRFHDAARATMGLRPLLLAPWRSDSTVRAIATLFATFTLEELDEALLRAQSDPFPRKLSDVGQWSPRVVRQLLGPPRVAGGRQPDDGDFDFEVDEAEAAS